MQESREALEGFYGLFNRLRDSKSKTVGAKDLPSSVDKARESFRKALDNDLNTPAAISELQNLRSEVNTVLDSGLSTRGRSQALQAFISLGAVVGLFQLDRWDYRIKPDSGHLRILGGEVKAITTGMSEEVIEAKIADRAEAKKRKDFTRADTIRAELALHGIIIEDASDGTSRWKRGTL